MTTFALALVDSLDSRWSEINLLIAEAEKNASKIDLYNALCRSASVLMVAQFEGFMRDLARAILDDINAFSSFSRTPLALKQTYSRSFLEKEEGTNSKEFQERIEKLIKTFDGLDTQFELEPFLVKDTEGHNKNPSPSVVEKIAGKFGVRKFFKLIDGSNLDVVFSETSPEIDKLKNNIKNHVVTGLYDFPYKLQPATFNIETSSVGVPASNARTFWEEFLDNVMSRRHDIAHGATFDNPNSVEEIKSNLVKIEILQLAILMVVCKKVTQVA